MKLNETITKIKLKYNQLKESFYLWVWKIRLEIDYKLYVITRKFA